MTTTQQDLLEHWDVIYKTLRFRYQLKTEDALDLTQDFFAGQLELDSLSYFDPARGTLKPYLMASLRNAVKSHARSARAHKRMPDGRILSMDDEELEATLGDPNTPAPDEVVGERQKQALVEEASVNLRETLECTDKGIHYEVFERFHFSFQGYREIADDLHLKLSDVDNYLRSARRLFREEIEKLHFCESDL